MLFVQIPVSKKPTADPDGLLTDELIGSSAFTSKALPSLAVLSISASTFLRSFYRVFYAVFAFSFFAALIPYISSVDSGVAIRLGWLVILLSSFAGLWHLYARQCSAIPLGSLAFENGFWILCDKKEQLNCVLSGDVLCWPWLIILPLESEAGQKRFLLLCRDAIKPADQARLRTWLRACLRPKG